MPEALGYLHEWLLELFGRSGVSMDGLAPLTYSTIADWARLTDRRPQPHEVKALLHLDLVMRHPDAGKESD